MMKLRPFALAGLAISSLLVSAAFAAGPQLLQPQLGQPQPIQPGLQFTQPAPVPHSLPAPQPLPNQIQIAPALVAPIAPVPVAPPMHHRSEYPPVESYQPIEIYNEARPVELYPNVTYRDLRRVHPQAVTYLVEVPLPAPRRARGCADCAPACALIKICVPPCETPRVKVRRRGHKLIYDFGKYEVNIIVRRTGRIIVNYDA